MKDEAEYRNRNYPPPSSKPAGEEAVEELRREVARLSARVERLERTRAADDPALQYVERERFGQWASLIAAAVVLPFLVLYFACSR